MLESTSVRANYYRLEITKKRKQIREKIVERQKKSYNCKTM